MDTFPVDFSSNIGRVRKYIPDLVQLADPSDPDGDAEFIMSDDELQSFIDDEAVDLNNVKPWEIKRAAAYAMIAIGNSENLILKKIVTQDQQTDGPSVAKQLIAAAATLMGRADAEAQANGVDAESFLAVFPSQTTAPNHYGYRRGWL